MSIAKEHRNEYKKAATLPQSCHRSSLRASIRRCLLVALGVLGVAGLASAQSLITYVDVVDGSSGNTKQIATNGTTPWNGTLTNWTALTSGGANNDSLWLRRAFGNNSTIYENSGAGAQDTNATRLITSITVPPTPPGAYYNVYAFFWTDTSPTWRVGASLTNYVGQLPLYQSRTPGVTILWNDSFASTSTNYSTNLAANPFTTSVKISESNRRLLMTPVLGEVSGTNITVYLEGDRNQQGQDQRTWIDGIGYQLISNCIMSPVILSNANLPMIYTGTPGRQYLIESTTSLTPPVTWTPLQSGTANSNGLVSFTATPPDQSDFYRIHDVTPPPAAVSNLTATAGDRQVLLIWAATVGATSYNVKMAATSGGPYTILTNINATNFVVTGLTDFTPYYFVVSALNFNGEGVNSTEVSATPLPPQPPTAPTGVTATAGNELVALNWTPPGTATSYNVKMSTASGGPYTTVTNVSTSSAVVNNLTNGTTYYFVVSALNAYGESTNSLEVNGTPAPVPPLAPTGLIALAGNAQVSLSWAAAPGATNYNVKIAATSGGPYTVVTNVSGNNLIVTGLTNATTYYFVVSGLNVYGEGPNSPEANATPFATPPLAYSVEDTSTNYTPPTLPNVPPVNVFPVIQPFPDPFTFVNDPLDINGTRSINYYDWEHHRAEIKAELEAYEVGPKPAVDPSQVTASYSGSTNAGGTGTITVHVTVGANTLTLTCAVTIPASATVPYPVCIGMDSPYGSLTSSDFTSRGIVGVTYSESQVSTYGNPSSGDPYHKLYGGSPYNFTVDNTGQYSAWAWGVSRLIDGLYQITNTLPIDVNHICVTGCSYAGKLALWSGALDERVALTVAQESGGGGDTSWRYSHTEPQGSVEDIDDTDYNWFANQMGNFSGNNVSYLPEDHHMLMALCLPRALYCTANTDYTWLSNPSAYVCGQACAQIYSTFGIGDRFGFNVDGGHSHCAFPSDQEPDLQYFLDRFIKGNTSLSQNIRSAPASYSTIDYSRWTTWWGTTNAVFGP